MMENEAPERVRLVLVGVHGEVLQAGDLFSTFPFSWQGDFFFNIPYIETHGLLQLKGLILFWREELY